jgi:hypothetical protein
MRVSNYGHKDNATSIEVYSQHYYGALKLGTCLEWTKKLCMDQSLPLMRMVPIVLNMRSVGPHYVRFFFEEVDSMTLSNRS